MGTHDILIGAVIVLILLVQFMVFRNALRRINLFKEVIPGSESFTMVKVQIPESQIKTLTVEQLLENNYLQTRQMDDSLEIEEETVFEWPDEGEEDGFSEYQDDEEVLQSDTVIWISNGNEEKKIAYELLKSYEKNGWQRI